MVFASAFHMASVAASSGDTSWEQEKIRDEFDEAWASTIGTGPDDPKYIRITSDMDKLFRFLLNSLFYSPTPMGRLPECFFQMYSQETGLLMFERLEGFDYVPNG